MLPVIFIYQQISVAKCKKSELHKLLINHVAYHFFAYGVVSKLEVDKHLVNNLLDVAAVTHRVQQVDGSLSNAHVTLRLTAQIYILL